MNRRNNTNNRNKKYIPSYPQYGLGSWIKGAVKDVGEFTGAKKVADWAGNVVGEDIRGVVKKGTGFAADAIGDITTQTADIGLGLVGAGDVIDEDAYENKFMGKMSNITSKYVAPAAGLIGATILTGGLAGAGAAGAAGAGAGLLGSGISAGTLAAGAMGGQAMGKVQQGVGAGMAQSQQKLQQQQMMQQQQDAINKQSLTQNRLGSYNRNQGYNYAPTFANGGMLKSYDGGGTLGPGISSLNPVIKAYSRHNAYKQPIDSAFIANFPEAKEMLDNAPVNRKDRMQQADSIALANPDMYLKGKLTDYVTPQQAKNYKESKKELESHTGFDLKGTGENPDAIGIRNLFMPSGAVKTRKYNGEIKARYNVNYDPSTNTYNREDLEFKNGGNVSSKKANGGYLEETRYNDDITYYPNGGTHESNPNGGVQIGNKGSVEAGEFRYGDYIFSNRF